VTAAPPLRCRDGSSPPHHEREVFRAL
jgi:hypothetical protein